MPTEKPKPHVVHQGQIIRVTETNMPDGRVFERAIRAPGTRTIVHDRVSDKILLSREFRLEINTYDYRLPGGKVRDRITDWDQIKDSPNLDKEIKQAAIKEVSEECGLNISEPQVFAISTSGGPTVEWTLYYLIATVFTEIGHQNLELGEDISTTWVDIPEVVDLCLSGQMQEGRSVAVLLQYLHSIGKI